MIPINAASLRVACSDYTSENVYRDIVCGVIFTLCRIKKQPYCLLFDRGNFTVIDLLEFNSVSCIPWACNRIISNLSYLSICFA